FGTDEKFTTTTIPETGETSIRLREGVFGSAISDAILRWEMDWYPTANHQLKWGAQGTAHRYQPGTLTNKQSLNNNALVDTTYGDSGGRGIEAFAFLEHDWILGDRFRINSGLHAAAYRYGDRTYTSLQPRFTARAMLANNLALKASYARMTQFVHLLVNQSVGIPVDIWVPATDRVAPQSSDQLAAGLAWESTDRVWDASLEGYYKQMTDLVDYRDGYGYFSSAVEGWENVVETGGEGLAYGGELFIRKQRGKLRGWLGYTLSWNWREFAEINQGNRYPFRYDRRHDLSLVAVYTLRPGIELSASWVYGTGQSITLATGRHESFFNNDRAFLDPEVPFIDTEGDIFIYDGGRNNQRMRDFHRLDIGASFTKEKSWGSRTWRVGVYNAYGRRNPFYYSYVRQSDNGEPRMSLVQYSLFPATPAVSYSISF
ncbi:MAG: TonB-dependent receptor, partial [Bacteroidota bacterium]